VKIVSYCIRKNVRIHRYCAPLKVKSPPYEKRRQRRQAAWSSDRMPIRNENLNTGSYATVCSEQCD